MALSRFSRTKQAWKSFTKKLRSKVRQHEIAASVRDSISRLFRLIVPSKTMYIHNTIPRTRFYNCYNNHGHDRRQPYRFLQFANKKCFRRHSESHNLQICQYQSQPWSDENVLERKMKKEEEEMVDSVEDAWRKVVAASPHLRVDERAGEFIYKFKQEMRMEKERSLLEFQERLIRSA